MAHPSGSRLFATTSCPLTLVLNTRWQLPNQSSPDWLAAVGAFLLRNLRPALARHLPPFD